MSDFLVHHASFARWGILILALGALISVVWSWRFRRLARSEIAPDELRWEARGGLVAGMAWLAALALLSLLIRTSAEINAVEVMAVSDEITPRLVEAVTYGLGLIAGPTGTAMAGALALLVFNGIWSGALAALRGPEGTP